MDTRGAVWEGWGLAGRVSEEDWRHSKVLQGARAGWMLAGSPE